ncbi:hypothetical protein CSB20_14430 [bacterium DOLZORAL124_64_63]|nr:MAG: hypothetical protein CSB20_14430 [bacterium DOLZORAL124_64_63]
MIRKWGLLLVAAGLVLLATVAMGQDEQPTSIQDSRLAQMTGAAAQTGEPEDEIVVTESVKEFIDKGKPIGHVIILLLVIGFFFVVDQLRVHLLEKVRGGEIYKADINAMQRPAVEKLIEAHSKSRVGRLLMDVSRIYRQSADMSLISAEAEFHREKEEHRFNTFEARMAFLADTAGGLGLLGTVWGIYRGFAAKSVAANNDDLLAAMGIALVTTFMGIVVSVILNWMSTEVGAMFRGRIMAALEKVEDYREMLVKDIGKVA